MRWPPIRGPPPMRSKIKRERQLLRRLEKDAGNHRAGERDWYKIFGQTAEWFMTELAKSEVKWADMTETEKEFVTMAWREQRDWMARQTRH